MRARQVASMCVATVLLAVGISAPAGAQTPSARLAVAFAPGFQDPPVLNLLLGRTLRTYSKVLMTE